MNIILSDENTFLIVWIKTLSSHYNLLNKDDKFTFIVNEYLYDDDFIYNFFLSHFKKYNIDNANLTKFQTLSLNISNYFDLFNFSKNNLNKITQEILDTKSKSLESKIYIWKIFFTLTFLEDISFNKYLKLDEVTANITNNSFMGVFSIINKTLPKHLHVRNLIRSPWILKSSTALINEVFNLLEVDSLEFQNILSNTFQEKNLNETELFYYEEEDPNLQTNNEYSVSPNKKRFNHYANYEDVTPIHSHCSTPNCSPQKMDNSFELDMIKLNCEKCDQCNHLKKINEELSNNIQNLNNIILKREEQINNLQRQNCVIMDQKNEVEILLLANEKVLNAYKKQERHVDQEINLLKNNLKEKLNIQAETIEKLELKIVNLKKVKNLFKEFQVKFEIIKNENDNLKLNLNNFTNISINNINLFSKENIDLNERIKNNDILNEYKHLSEVVETQNYKIVCLNKVIEENNLKLNELQVLLKDEKLNLDWYKTLVVLETVVLFLIFNCIF